MIVITATNIPDRLRGKLSVWCQQVNANTFVSLLPPEARDTLWRAIEAHGELGDVTMVYDESGELHVRHFGDPARILIARHGFPLSHRLR